MLQLSQTGPKSTIYKICQGPKLVLTYIYQTYMSPSKLKILTLYHQDMIFIILEKEQIKLIETT